MLMFFLPLAGGRLGVWLLLSETQNDSRQRISRLSHRWLWSALVGLGGWTGCLAASYYFHGILFFSRAHLSEIGILLFFLAVTVSYKYSSSALTKKYITEVYFEKHYSLLDSDFNKFIVHEFPIGSCEVLQDTFNMVPKPSVISRHLIGEGSHRRLSSSIGLNIQPESLSELLSHSCEVIIVERLPSEVFADPFELQHLINRGVFTDASAFGDTNLELPSVLSNRSVVEVHMDVAPNSSPGYKNELEINIELPLHARYLPLGEQGSSRIEFGLPYLFTRCVVQGNSRNQSCLFLSSDDSAKTNGGAVVWEEPCGIKEHARVVSIVTFVSAIVSAFLIVLACICSS